MNISYASTFTQPVEFNKIYVTLFIYLIWKALQLHHCKVQVLLLILFDFSRRKKAVLASQKGRASIKKRHLYSFTDLDSGDCKFFTDNNVADRTVLPQI